MAPLTLSTPERVAGGTCSAGQQCDRLAAVLMPDTATPSGPAAAEHAVPAPFEPVADTIAPGLVPRPGVPAAAAVPRVGPPAVPGLPNIPGAAGPALPPHRPCRTWPRRAYLASASRASASRASASRASASPAYPTQSPGEHRCRGRERCPGCGRHGGGGGDRERGGRHLSRACG